MDLNKIVETWDESDEYLNDKIDRTNLSAIVASASASAANKNSVSVIGTGKNIEVLKLGGKTVQNGTPTPTNPVEVKGVGDSNNLWDMTKALTAGSGTVVAKEVNRFTWNFNSGSYTIYTIIRGIKAGETYTFSCNNNGFSGAGSSYGCRIIVYNSSNTIIEQSTMGAKQTTLTIPQNASYMSVNYYVGTPCKQDGTITITDCMLEKGSVAHPYEPYGKYKIPISVNGNTQNIYLDAPLFDGEIADLVGGKVEKKWGMITLNGSESDWFVQTANGYGIANCRVPFPNTVNTALCDRFTRQDPSVGFGDIKTEGFMTLNSYAYLRIKSTTVSNVSQLTAWLSSNPVTIVYAMDFDEDFDGISIPTTATEQEVNINTEIVPTSIEAVTFGDYYSKAEIDRKFAELSDRLSAVETSAHEDDGVVVPEE